MTEQTIAGRQSATYGAQAFDPGNERLPGVFPRRMGPNVAKYLKEVVDSGFTSDMCDRFTARLAELYGVRFAIGTPGCTQAVFAAMLGADFEPGSEIIVSSIADYGSVAGILLENYIPVFADTEPGTALISSRTIEPHVNDRTRAILCVHKLGLPCDMDPIMELARKHGLVVITDLCQAILSRYKGSLTSTLGDVGCFSFDSEKTCPGDIGGAVVTDDEEFHGRIRNRAISRGAYNVPGYGRKHVYRGFATRMPQCTAATCLGNLKILEEQVRNRQATAEMLNDLIRPLPGVIPYGVPPGRTHTYWMYGFSVDTRAFSCAPHELASQLSDAGIPGVGMGKYYLMPEALSFLREKAEAREYPFSLMKNPDRHTYSARAVPNAKAFLDTWIRWPWTEKYTVGHVEYMGRIIEEAVRRNAR
ncbi:MAG: DegT/DnrJ/EryC1/StrS family aminotransferase [Armatimonadetes bacterium]|nr:DegT/DnrJ/EryC1/StrS family aminotransferase [Armatimonadota bacterium]